MTDSTRWAWARLNADTLFVALLAIGAGIFAVLDPLADAVVAARGSAAALFYVRAGAYVFAGLLLVAALGRESVRLETMARSVLIGGVALNVYRHATWLGWGDTQTQANVVLLVIVVGTSWLRMSVLLNRDGFVVSRPSIGDQA